MRGKALEFLEGIRKTRITPAYAGKRSGKSTESSKQKDHPRLCGEKCSAVGAVLECVGSPPPMRGKGQAFSGRIRKAGITPAYAGKRCLGHTGIHLF